MLPRTMVNNVTSRHPNPPPPPPPVTIGQTPSPPPPPPPLLRDVIYERPPAIYDGITRE